MQRGSDPLHERPHDRTAVLLIVLFMAELLAFMAFLVPLMGAGNPPAPGGAGVPGGATQAPVFGWGLAADSSAISVLVSLVGGALGGTLHGLASLTAHLAADDFDRR